MGLLYFNFVLFICIAIKFSSKMVLFPKFGLDANLTALFLFVTNLTSTLFSMFSMVLPNTELFMSLKKSFSKVFVAFALRSVFSLMYLLNHALS